MLSFWGKARFGLAFLALTCTAVPAQADETLSPALEHAPRGAQAILLAPSLGELEARLADLNRNVGLNISELNHLGTVLRAGMGLNEGLDEEGPAMVVVPNLVLLAATLSQPHATPPILFFVPVRDYPAFARSLGADPSGRVSAFEHPQGVSGHIRRQDSFAVLSPMKGALDAYVPSGEGALLIRKWGPLANRTFAQADLAFYMDIQGVAPALLPLLTLALEQLAGQAEPLTSTSEQKALIHAARHRGLNVGLALLSGVQNLVLTLDLSPEGVGGSAVLTLVPDSLLAAGFADRPPSRTRELLGSLPDRSFLLAGAVDTERFDLSALSSDLADVPETDATAALVQTTLGWWKQASGFASSLYAPDPENILSGGLLNGLVLAHSEVPLQLRERIHQTFVHLAQLSATSDNAPKAFRLASLYQPHARLLAGEPVDQFDLQVELSDSPSANPWLPLMMMLGGSGSRGLVASSESAVLLSTVADETLLAAGLQAARDPGNAGLGRKETFEQLRKEQLPGGLIAEAYLSLHGWLETANTFLPLFGFATLPADPVLPPLACGVGVEENTLSLRMFLPTDTLRAAAQAVGHFIPR